jgi:hypothetical protein
MIHRVGILADWFYGMRNVPLSDSVRKTFFYMGMKSALPIPIPGRRIESIHEIHRREAPMTEPSCFTARRPRTAK